MKSVKLLSAIAVLCVSTSLVQAQTVLAAWNMGNLTDGGPSPMAPTDSNANVTVMGLTRGSGLSIPDAPAVAAWGAQGFNDGIASASQSVTTAIDNGNYVTFSVTANPGYQESFTSIGPYNLRKASTSSPGNLQWQYSIDGTNFTNIGSTVTVGGVLTAAGNNKTAVPLNTITALQDVPAGTTVTFRAVLWGASSDGAAWYFNSSSSATLANRILTINGTVTPSVGLPLELISFKGKQAAHANVLSWITASEKDIMSFELERGVDGRNFAPVASFAAKGNGLNARNEYAYTDNDAEAVAYYRLKMSERNDKARYSDVVVMRSNTTEAAISLYPNPAADQLILEGLQGTVSYRVSDVQGNIVMTADAKATENGKVAVSIAQLPAGNYFIHLGSGNQLHTLRFVKK